jgi:ribonuclease BN (tRNA processing enzyme)
MQQTTITFVGSGDAFGSGGRLQACILVNGTNSRLLIDCGTTSLIGMRRLGIDPNSIPIILLSHLHGDHFGGLPFFILDAQFVSKRTEPLLVVGPKGTPDRVGTLADTMFPGMFLRRRDFPLQIVELQPERRTEVGEAFVTAYEVEHPSGTDSPALGFRIEWEGKIIGYSGDTEWTENLISIARASDLFIAEASSFDEKVRYHLDVESLKAHLGELACRRLIVTHMGETVLARLDDLPFEHADDGMTIQI